MSAGGKATALACIFGQVMAEACRVPIMSGDGLQHLLENAQALKFQ